MTTRHTPLVLALSALALSSCGSDPSGVEPTVAQVAGTYIAQGDAGEFEIRQPDPDDPVAPWIATDWLARGATVRMTLGINLVTEGHLFIPGAAEDGGDFTSEFEGAWRITQAGDIELLHSADDLLRELTYRLDGDRLVGESSSPNQQIRLVVIRTGSF